MSITLINPFILTPIVEVIRNFFTNGYNSGRLSTTSTAYIAAQTLTTTEISGTDYVAFWQSTVDNNSVTLDSRTQLFETSVRQSNAIESQDATDALSVGGAFPYAGGTDKTFQIQYSSEGTNLMGIAGRALNVLALDPSDKWAHNAGTTNATANAVSVTITEPGDYFVIGTGVVGAGDSAAIFDGSTLYGAIGVSMNQDATTVSAFWHIEKLTLTNETLSVRCTLGFVRQASIIALRADKFKNTYWAGFAGTQVTTTSSTFVTGQTNTFTIENPANYHLVLGSGYIQSSATNSSAGAKLINTSRNINYNVSHFRENNAATEWYPTVVTRLTSFVDPTPTLEWQFYSESNNTARLRNTAIAIFDLGIAAPPSYFIASTSIVNSTTLDISDQTEEGDIVVVASHSTNTAPNTPTGFTNIENSNQNTVFHQSSYKVMGVTPDTVVSGLTANANMKHIAMVFRYVDIANVLDVAVVTTTNTSLTPDPGSITSTNRSIILAIGYLDDDAVTVDVTAPVGFTLCGVEQASGTIMAAYKIQAAAGTEDPSAFTGGTDAWVAHTIALRLV